MEHPIEGIALISIAVPSDDACTGAVHGQKRVTNMAMLAKVAAVAQEKGPGYRKRGAGLGLPKELI